MARRPKKQKRNTKQNKQANLEDFEQIDAYYIPKEQAELYRALREAIAEEMKEELAKHYPDVRRQTDDPEQGEAVVAYDDAGEVAVRYFLKPTNLSEAQKARDKQQMDTYVEQMLETLKAQGKKEI